MSFYAWKKGLKTGMYYLRSRPAVDAIQFTVDQAAAKTTMSEKAFSDAKPLADKLPVEATTEREVHEEYEEYENEKLACSIENRDACVMCSG